MKYAVIYWSQTGNTEAMAEHFTDKLRALGAVDTYTASEVNPSAIDDYDVIAFGCPAMGAEVLEEAEFEPMFQSVLGQLAGKKVILFGSYDWGNGQWMRDWKDTVEAAGASIVGEPLIFNLAPDDVAFADADAIVALLG